MRTRLCSQDTFVPGERGRSGTWKEGGCARRDFRACGVGSGELDGGCGEWQARRPPGGHRELREPPPAPAPPSSPIRPRAEQPHSSPRCVEIRAGAAAAGGPLRRCSAAQAPAAQRRLPRLRPGRCPGTSGAPGPTNRPSRHCRGRPALPAARPPQPRQARPAPPAGAGSPG